MRRIVPVVVFGGVIAAALPACADTVSGSLSVQITIQKTCTVSAAPLNFGTVNLLTSAVPAQADITVTCTNTTPYVVGLDAGAHESSANDVNTRRMANAGATAFVTYQLYKQVGHSTVWGPAAALADTDDGQGIAGTGNGSAQTITVYGLVPIQATPAPDTYNDTVAILVTY